MIRKKLAQSDLIDTNYLSGHENDLFLHKKQKYINKPAKKLSKCLYRAHCCNVMFVQSINMICFFYYLYLSKAAW